MPVDIFLCPVKTGNDIWLCDPTVAHGTGVRPRPASVFDSADGFAAHGARRRRKAAELEMLLALDSDFYFLEAL